MGTERELLCKRCVRERQSEPERKSRERPGTLGLFCEIMSSSCFFPFSIVFAVCLCGGPCNYVSMSARFCAGRLCPCPCPCPCPLDFVLTVSVPVSVSVSARFCAGSPCPSPCPLVGDCARARVRSILGWGSVSLSAPEKNCFGLSAFLFFFLFCSILCWEIVSLSVSASARFHAENVVALRAFLLFVLLDFMLGDSVRVCTRQKLYFALRAFFFCSLFCSILCWETVSMSVSVSVSVSARFCAENCVSRYARFFFVCCSDLCLETVSVSARFYAELGFCAAHVVFLFLLLDFVLGDRVRVRCRVGLFLCIVLQA